MPPEQEFVSEQDQDQVHSKEEFVSDQDQDQERPKEKSVSELDTVYFKETPRRHHPAFCSESAGCVAVAPAGRSVSERNTSDNTRLIPGTVHNKADTCSQDSSADNFRENTNQVDCDEEGGGYIVASHTNQSDSNCDKDSSGAEPSEENNSDGESIEFSKSNEWISSENISGRILSIFVSYMECFKTFHLFKDAYPKHYKPI